MASGNSYGLHVTTKMQDVINKGDDDESILFGFKKNSVKTTFTYIGYVFTLLLLRLVYFWLPHVHMKSTHVPSDLHEADKVLVKDQFNRLFVEDVHIVSETGVKLHVHGGGPPRSLHAANCKPGRPCVETATEDATGVASRPIYANNSTQALHPSSSCPGVSEESTIRYFVHKKIKYVWNRINGRFARNEVFNNTQCAFFHKTPGLEKSQARLEFVKFGENRVHIPLTPIWKLLILQVLHPFYVFQVFSVTLWIFEEYITFAIVIIVMSTVSLAVTVFVTAKSERNLRKTLVDSSMVKVFRGSNASMELNSSQLVPGDIIQIPQLGCLMQCDAVLVTGNCIVNESMLTGESVPLLKTPVPSVESKFGMKEHSKHVLFCGTRVIQTRHTEDVKAVVVRTGFMTSKGELVRSILFPKPNVFTFNRDVINYLEVLGVFALVGFIYTVVLMKQRDDEWQKIVIRALDIITIAVPPALPAAMTIGIVFAQSRLRKRQIFCIAPKTINVSGAVNLVCFDKTGTLTESGMDLWGALPVKATEFLQPEPAPSSLAEPSQMLEAMATSHALTRIDDVLSGDPLDLKMFESTGWQLEEPDTIDYSRCDRLVNLLVRSPVTKSEIGVVRQFTFSSDLQRMSVIAGRVESGRLELPLMAYVKGSPEMIHSLCLPDTIPADFHDHLMQYTSQGYRVIGLACRQLPSSITADVAQRINRNEVERDLRFLGLLVMENRLKPETVASIGTLTAANIRPVMVTGDNILTALSVARECGIIADSEVAVIVRATEDNPDGDGASAQVDFAVYGDPRRQMSESAILSSSSQYRLAITGASWQVVRSHFPELAPRLAVRGAIFARFSPAQKVQVVECLQELGYIVAMCGDGANDCGALKTAHAGISLSEAEASVASPFTSKEQNISCVIRLIQEGRCALVTSFGIFKYMACYSMTQFVSVLLLYWIASNLTNNQFVYIDLFLVTSHFITYSYTEAYNGIDKEPPNHRLLSFVTVTSIVLQCCIVTGFQVLAYFYVLGQAWFYPFVYDASSDMMACYENTAVFLMSVHQYVILAIVFSKSAPYRRPMFTNYAFMVNIAVVVGVNLFIIFAPSDWLGQLLEMWDAPLDNPNLQLKFLLIGASLLNFLLCLIVEQLVESTWFGRLVRKAARSLLARPKKFELIARELKRELGHWPPISDRYRGASRREMLEFVSSINPPGNSDKVTAENEKPADANDVALTERARTPGRDFDDQNKKKEKKPYYTAL